MSLTEVEKTAVEVARLQEKIDLINAELEPKKKKLRGLARAHHDATGETELIAGVNVQKRTSYEANIVTAEAFVKEFYPGLIRVDKRELEKLASNGTIHPDLFGKAGIEIVENQIVTVSSKMYEKVNDLFPPVEAPPPAPEPKDEDEVLAPA